jgi:uncharacterized protein YndB with AHSA1/START domain
VDVTHEINTVARRVGTRTIDAGQAWTVVLTRTYDTTVDDLWDACTNPERIPRWFLPVTGELEVGGQYQLEGNANGTIESCDPPHGFTATWEFDNKVSWIELRLTEADGGATFELTHIHGVADDHWREFGPGAVGIGYELALTGLDLHLASGEAQDPQAAMAWMGSDEGKKFVTECSDRWREAHVAGGADPDVARASADRTTTAYTAG